MSLQNRVTPLGEIVAIPQRGMFTGNRGIIHDPATKTLARRWTSKAWLICACEFRGRRRDVMARRSWTELFFLDEATALAAGHRPCFLCRREDANRFRAAWSVGNKIQQISASELDAELHTERLNKRTKRLHPLMLPWERLPDGAFVSVRGSPVLIAKGRAFEWTEQGYRPFEMRQPVDGLITPPSTIQALAHGYKAVLHPTSA
jgi:hypothetical protein